MEKRKARFYKVFGMPILEIRVDDKSDWGVDFDKMKDALKYVGHVGLEWIKFLESIGKEGVREAFEQAKREHGHKFSKDKDLATIQQALYATSILLKQFGFEVNTEDLDELFEELKEDTGEKTKQELVWLGEFMAWVIANIHDFECMGKTKTQKDVVLNRVEANRYKGRLTDRWLIITKSAFENFCKEKNIDAGAFLSFLSKQGAIRKFRKSLCGRLTGPTGQICHYYINLHVVNKLIACAIR